MRIIFGACAKVQTVAFEPIGWNMEMGSSDSVLFHEKTKYRMKKSRGSTSEKALVQKQDVTYVSSHLHD